MSHVVISGGGTGVGAAIAQSFAKSGAEVTLMGRTEGTLAEQGLPYEVCDVTDAQQVQAAFDAARAARGPGHCGHRQRGRGHVDPVPQDDGG